MFRIPKKQDVERVAAELLESRRAQVQAVFNGALGGDNVRQFVQENLNLVVDEDAFAKCMEIMLAAGIVVGSELATTTQVYAVVREDGAGHYLLDTSGVCCYADPEVAREDIRRMLFPSGYAVLPLPIATKPLLLGTPEQQKAWKEKK